VYAVLYPCGGYYCELDEHHVADRAENITCQQLTWGRGKMRTMSWWKEQRNKKDTKAEPAIVVRTMTKTEVKQQVQKQSQRSLF
jgi:hypothetical protein